jgi:hypothetical protein
MEKGIFVSVLIVKYPRKNTVKILSYSCGTESPFQSEIFVMVYSGSSINSGDSSYKIQARVPFETSFDSKQPKLEPKLVSALSETKRLFWLFRFYTETESFAVSIEPKQTEDQPKQFDREHILVFS